MSANATAAALSFALLVAIAPAQIALPTTGQRFVDFSAELAHPDAVVAIGALGKWKEGRRERMADGKLGGVGQVAVIAGTQFFKVPVTATLQPRTVLRGKPGDAAVAFDLQLARLPDGKEHRQTTAGALVAADRLALFVLVPKAKKGFELRCAIPFEATDGGGGDAEAVFADTMRDYYTVNLRKHELGLALAAVDGAKDGEARTAALAALRELLGKKPELLQPKNDPLLSQHVGPLEVRAQKRLADADAAAKPDAGK